MLPITAMLSMGKTRWKAFDFVQQGHHCGVSLLQHVVFSSMSDCLKAAATPVVINSHSFGLVSQRDAPTILREQQRMH